MNNRFLLFLTPSIFFAIGCQSIVDDSQEPTDNNIDITQAPFALSFKCNGSHICGATIISEVWGITAAHCVIPVLDSPSNCSVRSGSTFKDKDGSLHNVTKMIAHESYNRTNSDYDVAVFMIDPPFDFDSTTQPIALPTDTANKTAATVIGWGAFSTKNETVLSDDLKGVTLPLMERRQCMKDYEGSFVITPRQLCYGFQQGGQDACKGDSGGPLFNIDNILIGITSWGDECGGKYSPGVYTDVLTISDWIKSQTEI